MRTIQWPIAAKLGFTSVNQVKSNVVVRFTIRTIPVIVGIRQWFFFPVHNFAELVCDSKACPLHYKLEWQEAFEGSHTLLYTE